MHKDNAEIGTDLMISESDTILPTKLLSPRDRPEKVQKQKPVSRHVTDHEYEV